MNFEADIFISAQAEYINYYKRIVTGSYCVLFLTFHSITPERSQVCVLFSHGL